MSTININNTINVAIHVHFSISQTVEEPAALQETFYQSLFHEASQFGLHPPKGTDSGEDGLITLPVKMHAADQHEALQKAKDWAVEISERDAPEGLSIKKIETGAAPHDW